MSEALTALASAVSTGSDRAAIPALDGLGVRTGEGTCAAITPGLPRAEDVAFHARSATTRRGC